MKVNWFAPINNLGIGTHAHNLMKAYARRHSDSDISLITPFGKVSINSDQINTWLTNPFNRDNPSIMIFQPSFMSQFSGTPMIGYPVFEMKTFTPRELDYLRACDYLIVPSQWGKAVLDSYNDMPQVLVVPEGYDPLIYYPDNTIAFKVKRIEDNGVTFVTVGKFEERKGTKDVIECFDQGTAGKRANLIAHVHNPFDQKWFFRIAALIMSLGYEKEPAGESFTYFVKDKQRIIIPMGPVETNKDMASFYRRADFGLFMSKAEGWNLPLLECIASGTPAITTDWTGMSDFVNEHYPQEIKIKTKGDEITNDGVWFKGDRGEWTIPDKDHATSIIKDLMEDTGKYLLLTEKCVNAVKDFTWDKAAEKLDEVLCLARGKE
jgi:glycosyltransferase involved in cell wall biosynthesis